jgi:hypothetical protein
MSLLENPNIEILNKFEYQMFKTKPVARYWGESALRSFEFGSFDIVSNFGFRASNFHKI